MKRPLGIRHAEQPNALLVTMVQPRQSQHLRSQAIASQGSGYLDDQFSFVDNLSPSVRSALIVRLSTDDYGWDQKSRWHDRFPDVRLDDGRRDINSLIRDSRICISTYNGTGFLESFTMNVPTVMYWNPRHWELRDSAVPYFEDLKRVGIFHETPESAARHMTSIWNDVDGWWSSAQVREALARFKTRYCFLPDDLLDRIECELREIVVGSDKAAAA